MAIEKLLRLSRRDFNKLLFGYGAAVFATGLCMAGGGILEYERRKRNAAWLTGIERYPEELAWYGREGVGLIDDIEKNLNLLVPLPGTKPLPSICREADVTGVLQDENNKAWSLAELVTLSQVAECLPKSFQMDDRAILAKYSVGGIEYGGCMTETFIGLLVPEQFEPTMLQVWPSKEKELAGVFIHELAHDLIGRNRYLVVEYAGLTGWRQVEGYWFNPDNISARFGVWRYVEQEGPEHELIFLTSFYVTNPDLVRQDVVRFNFLRDHLFEGKTY